jgi:hypothetical protein
MDELTHWLAVPSRRGWNYPGRQAGCWYLHEFRLGGRWAEGCG